MNKGGAVVAAISAVWALQAPLARADDKIRIGFITDMSGLYADFDGPGGAEAIKMAIADAGGKVNGKTIELLVADHQNRPDIAAARRANGLNRKSSIC
jgi:branched-chain amino acid transport system substrate-binding protein